MRNPTKNGRGGKPINKAAAAGKRADAPPVLGEAALKAALAGFGASSANGSHAAAGGPQGQTEPRPKTVSQVLGEITWLMTQSPRHKSIPLGDLEWLLMPAILLRQFRIFYKGEQPVGVAALGAGRRSGGEADRRRRQAPDRGGMEERNQPAHHRYRRAVWRRGRDARGRRRRVVHDGAMPLCRMGMMGFAALGERSRSTN